MSNSIGLYAVSIDSVVPNRITWRFDISKISGGGIFNFQGENPPPGNMPRINTGYGLPLWVMLVYNRWSIVHADKFSRRRYGFA